MTAEYGNNITKQNITKCETTKLE